MKKQVGTIIGIILIILVASFSLMNLNAVEINFGFTRIQAPLIILILVSLLLGALIIFMFSSTQNLKKNREMKRFEKLSNAKQLELSTQIQDLKDNLTKMENRLKNSAGKQVLGEKDQQIVELEKQIEKLNKNL
ncbi:lipopolysaccharide assembly protein LapA domain-containing protein [Lentilactobacillus sp. SPB1-3]|uniref:Lipopolysaccharide assembly protein LapA domain-containing protein n=1 Tax=Lentilactobacillus terminaliae TaxID=3003483 RepID=A0ACD5DDD9_9LACO|nr:lipopolysaccharide assembly protein LapA domain-containing protein [Lentilactobacillus sp. SPB1-3]MCZ0977895.1 lipopolysaccharide assembly protein LapA domain-containing protein [Lentilactobacillus sp. SPB1-3]